MVWLTEKQEAALVLPSDIDGETVLHDASLLDVSAAGVHCAPSPVHLPRLGYKRCTACRQRRAIKGGSQKGGRFVCLACLDTRSP